MIKWIETTLRKGTKTPKICRDMFIICDARGDYKLTIVSNGRIHRKGEITLSQACEYQRKYKLKGVDSIFNGCFTFRTQASNELIASIIETGDK